MKTKQLLLFSISKNTVFILLYVLLIPLYLLFLTRLIIMNGNEAVRDYTDGM
jgi:hypothetical protein